MFCKGQGGQVTQRCQEWTFPRPLELLECFWAASDTPAVHLGSRMRGRETGLPPGSGRRRARREGGWKLGLGHGAR